MKQEVQEPADVYGAPIGTLLYLKLTNYAKLLVLWIVLQHELYAEHKN